MKVSSQYTLSHFLKIARIKQEAEPPTREITLIKIREGREKQEAESED